VKLEKLTEPAQKESVDDFLEKIAFQRVKRLLKENAGLNTDGYRYEYLKRRFEVRLRATGIATYMKYSIYLKNHPEEYQLLLNDLTINFTSFFRDTDVYDYLEKALLPKLFASNAAIRIWSAGCASGEEPYSLAILAHKLLGESSASQNVLIYATDIDTDALEKARRGEFHEKQASALPSSLIDKYFVRDDKVLRVQDFLRRFIRFDQLDLNASPPHKGLDLILCRNVMIYFSKEGQQRIHMNFYGALREGGYFITGKSEMLSGEPSLLFHSVEPGCRVYQKHREPAVQPNFVRESVAAKSNLSY
jgi:chemotaxis protein methyltransferase CheR